MTKRASTTRRRALQTVAAALAGIAAGCNRFGTSAPSDGAERTPTATASSTPTATDAPTETETRSVEDVMDFERNPADVHTRLVEETSVPDDEILIGFRLEDATLPFTTEVYRAPADAEIGATENYDTQDLGAISLLPDDPSALPTVDTDNEDVHYDTTTVGQPAKVTLVARHDERLKFSAWNRDGHPVGGHQDSLEVDCYCTGQHYTVPSGGTWARVIQVTPTEKVDPGTTIALNWTSAPIV